MEKKSEEREREEYGMEENRNRRSLRNWGIPSSSAGDAIFNN